MKYTLLVVLTNDNETYKTQLENYLSEVECIEEIRYLNLYDRVNFKETDSKNNDPKTVKVSIKSSFAITSGHTLISKIQNAVKDLKDKYCMVLPQGLLPSKKFFNYSKGALDDSTAALILGLHDNKVVSKDELLSPKENYTIYTVYNKKPSVNDLENCILCKVELLKFLPSNLEGHFATLSLYEQSIKQSKKVAYAVNERLCFDKDNAKLFAKDTFRHDLKLAQKSGIVPSEKLSFLEKLFSIKKFNGRTLYTVLGQSVSIKYKKTPTFPKNAIEVSERGVNAIKTEFQHKRACLFASFTKDGLVSNNTLAYLKSIRDFCDVIVYVADSKALPETLEKLKEL